MSAGRRGYLWAGGAAVAITAAVAVLAMTGNGPVPSPPSSPVAAPPPDASQPWSEADLRQSVVCVGRPFPFAVFSKPADALLADDEPARVLRQMMERNTELPGNPLEGWRRLVVTDSRVEFGRGTPPVLNSFVIVELAQGEWQPTGWGGGCVVRPSVKGGEVAAWKLDPQAPAPGPADTSLQVLVSDSQCAGGLSPEGRLRDPEVRVLPKEVVVTFTADRLVGMYTCPSHPPVVRTVELPEPLGQRNLRDGSTVPALAPCLRAGFDCER